jgi:hypothetical protein
VCVFLPRVVLKVRLKRFVCVDKVLELFCFLWNQAFFDDEKILKEILHKWSVSTPGCVHFYSTTHV